MKILSIPIHSGLNRPVSGGQNRSFHIIQELKKRGNSIIVLEPQEYFDVADRELAEIYTYPNYRVFCRGLNLLKDVDIWFISKLVRILRERHVDLIAIEHSSGTLAVRFAALLTKTHVPLIYAAQNVESVFARDVVGKVGQFSRFERRMLVPYVTLLEKLTTRHLVNHITAVSEADKALLCSKYGLDREKVTVIPSGCELRDSVDLQTKKRLRAKMGFDPDCVVVVFHGSYSHPPNRDAIDAIATYIAPLFENDESVLFVLYGTDVPRFEHANVKSFGFVEDLHKALSAADIALVPLTSGGGTKLKLFDYMNASLPIITTRKGIEGIRASDKEHVIIVEGVDDKMANAIKHLAQDRQERDRLGLNARRLVEKEYTWEIIGDKLNNTYRTIGGQ